jgi:hypothetical protein
MGVTTEAQERETVADRARTSFVMKRMGNPVFLTISGF